MARLGAEEAIRVLDDFVCEAIPGPGIAATEGAARRVDDGMRIVDKSCDSAQDSQDEPRESDASSLAEADKVAQDGR